MNISSIYIISFGGFLTKMYATVHLKHGKCKFLLCLLDLVSYDVAKCLESMGAEPAHGNVFYFYLLPCDTGSARYENDFSYPPHLLLPFTKKTAVVTLAATNLCVSHTIIMN